MDVLVVRRLNVPKHNSWLPEIVIGAVASGGVRGLDFGVLTSCKVHPRELEQATAFEQLE
jgi:predicted phosphoribosyltransferase